MLGGLPWCYFNEALFKMLPLKNLRRFFLRASKKKKRKINQKHLEKILEVAEKHELCDLRGRRGKIKRYTYTDRSSTFTFSY